MQEPKYAVGDTVILLNREPKLGVVSAVHSNAIWDVAEYDIHQMVFGAMDYSTRCIDTHEFIIRVSETELMAIAVPVRTRQSRQSKET